MTIAQHKSDEGFAKARIKVALSDHLTSFDCLLYWYFQSIWSKEFDGPPPIKRSQIMEALGVGKDTVIRSLKRLTSSGWISLVDDGHDGQRPILRDEATEPDTYHGFKHKVFLETENPGFAKLTRDFMTGGPTPRAIRIWVIMMIIRGHDERKTDKFGWAYAQHADFASWVSDPGKKLHSKTVASDIDVLVEFGLVEVDVRSEYGKMNRYKPMAHLGKYDPKLKVVQLSGSGDVCVYGTASLIDHEAKRLEDSEAGSRIARMWLDQVFGENIRSWVNENKSEARDIINTVIDAVGNLGEEKVVILVQDAIEEYDGYPADYLIKILDEVLDDLDDREFEAVMADVVDDIDSKNVK